MQYLINIIKNPIGVIQVEEVAALSLNDIYSITDLINLSFHKEEQIAFRAAWILERIYSNHQSKLMPYTTIFLDKLPLQQNLSALRHYVKILAFITKKNAAEDVQNIMNNYDTNYLAEVIFGWLIDEKIPVAVKSHCLNILANLCTKHSWIRDELTETMDYLVDKESIAFFAKVKQIRKQLKNTKLIKPL
ncbi:hypothetical protein [Pedobacter jejuensis]|uniref:HEAT repeat domain-containing protein n=1 Tax=Pedobacter jejuensis TaxID=1268550 RepID=A0A3N0C2E2_9SPHI|nr:hypothetical protein [Pedobacter jejuensis]RNL56571.1 hypothetical protein D7004_01395 [Pedobacter jejuensis]